MFQFIVDQRHQSTALDSCHQEVAHQGQCRSTTLMQEHFWWPGMTRDLRNCIKKCGHCRKYEAAPPVVPMKCLTCSGPGEYLHVDFTSIEETVPLREECAGFTGSLLQVCCGICGERSDCTYCHRDSEERVFQAVLCACLPHQ